MGCLVVQMTRVGGNVSAGTERIGGGVSGSAERIGGGVSASASRVGSGMSAWFGLICGPSLIPPYLRVCDGGYVLTVDGGYIILNEPYNDLNDGRD